MSACPIAFMRELIMLQLWVLSQKKKIRSPFISIVKTILHLHKRTTAKCSRDLNLHCTVKERFQLSLLSQKKRPSMTIHRFTEASQELKTTLIDNTQTMYSYWKSTNPMMRRAENLHIISLNRNQWPRGKDSPEATTEFHQWMVVTQMAELGFQQDLQMFLWGTIQPSQ